MKKINNCKLILFIIIVSFSFLSLFNGEVLAQTLKPVSNRFTGVWQGEVSHVISKKKSSIVGDIALVLCVQNGKLNGTVSQEGVYSGAAITTTQVISKKDVVVTLNDIQGNAKTLRLVTVGSKKLNGSFSNNLFIYTKKINSDGCGALVQSEDNNQPGGQPGGQEGSTSSSGGGQQGGTSSTEEISIPSAINPIDVTKIPIGDGNVLMSAKVGNVFACKTSVFDDF